MSTRLTEKDVQGTLSIVSELIGKELRLRCVNRTVTPQRYQIFTADNWPWPHDHLTRSLKETELYLRGVLAGIYAQQETDKQAKLVELWAYLSEKDYDQLLVAMDQVSSPQGLDLLCGLANASIAAMAGPSHAEKVYNEIKIAYYNSKPYGSLPPVNLPQSIIEKWEESLRLIGKR